jgi:folate-binding protein YgfZ
MIELTMREFHRGKGATFGEVNGCEVVAHYGNPGGEYNALVQGFGVMDISFRGRLCLLGGDRQRFLHGQVTNDVNRLRIGQGCYAALVNAKAKLLSDLNVWVLENELLLDFEPGFDAAVQQRLEQFIIADDVEVVDVRPHYGCWTIQGPRAGAVAEMVVEGTAPGAVDTFTRIAHSAGDVYLMQARRLGKAGFDLYVPQGAMEEFGQRLTEAIERLGGAWVGWEAFELARIEAGIPRFGQDMDETNLAPEAGLEQRAISYSKGCYIGQEIIARIRTYGQVAKALRGLWFEPGVAALAARGDKVLVGDREVGYVTSAIESPRWGRKVALAYVRKEHNQPGTRVRVRIERAGIEVEAEVRSAPFEVVWFVKQGGVKTFRTSGRGKFEKEKDPPEP